MRLIGGTWLDSTLVSGAISFFLEENDRLQTVAFYLYWSTDRGKNIRSIHTAKDISSQTTMPRKDSFFSHSYTPTTGV